MNYRRKAILSFVGAALSALFVAFVFSLSAQAEDSWKYAWDEDVREAVKFFKILGWCFVVIAVADVIKGIAYSVAHEKEKDAEAMGSAGQRDQYPTSPVVGAVRCSFCNHTMSRNAVKCMYCGTPVLRPMPDRSGTRAQVSVSDKTNTGNRTTRKCLFCDEPLTEKQTFCGACGRRQD